MPVESLGTMLGNVGRSRGVFAAEALNTRFGTARSLHLLPTKDKDKVRDKNKDSNPNNHTRIGVGRWLTPTSRTGHLSKPRPDLPTNCPETMGIESMSCIRRKQKMLPML